MKNLIDEDFANGTFQCLTSKLLDQNNIIIQSPRAGAFGFYIDDIFLGVIRYGQVNIAESVCYFSPSMKLFDFIEYNSIKQFIKIANKLSIHFSEFFLSDEPNKMRDKELKDFVGTKDNYYRIKMDKNYVIKEMASIIFSIKKEYNHFEMHEQCYLNLSCHHPKNYSIAHPEMNVRLSMKNNKFILNHEYTNYFPILEFDFNNIPDFDLFTENIVDYTLMSIYGIDLPNIEDFNSNKKMYKDIISMNAIS